MQLLRGGKPFFFLFGQQNFVGRKYGKGPAQYKFGSVNRYHLYLVSKKYFYKEEVGDFIRFPQNLRVFFLTTTR